MTVSSEHVRSADAAEGGFSAVRMTGVGVTFSPIKAPPVVALEAVDLSAANGAFISLIGPSGCGKSTLLRVIADLVGPTAGHVEVLGGSPSAARLDQKYGFAFQQPTLFEWRSVSQNIELPLALSHVPKEERSHRARRMLELVKLEDFAHHRPSQLSGGMQQRVAIARALSFEPELLLMDEPFGALDEISREHLQNELLRIWRETRTTIIFVTHSIAEAVFLSTKVVVMTPRPGRIHEVVDVSFEGRRDNSIRETTEFFEKVSEVRRALRSEGVL